MFRVGFNAARAATVMSGELPVAFEHPWGGRVCEEVPAFGVAHATCLPRSSVRQAAQILAITQHAKFSATPKPTSQPTLEIDAFKKSQDLKRPISPHLTIYQPQLTWYMSAAHRITGAGIAGLMYLGAMVYAVAPFSSAAVATAISSLPYAVTFLGKLTIAFPTIYHSVNGVRHLIWDTGSQLSLKGVYQTGYAALAVSTALTLYVLVAHKSVIDSREQILWRYILFYSYLFTLDEKGIADAVMDRRSSPDLLEDLEGDVSVFGGSKSSLSSFPAFLPTQVPPPEDHAVNQILSKLLTEPYLSIPEPMPDDKLDILLEPFREHFGNVSADTDPEKRPYRLWNHENKFRFCGRRSGNALAMRYIYPFSKHFRAANGIPRSLLIAAPNVLIEAPNPPEHQSTKRPAEDPKLPASNRSKSTAEETIANLKESLISAVMERDRRCLFCWELDDSGLEACHIVGSKLRRSAFSSNVGNSAFSGNLRNSFGFGNDFYDTSNGLLLCANCHKKFDSFQFNVEEHYDESGRLMGHHVDFVSNTERKKRGLVRTRAGEAEEAAMADIPQPRFEDVLIHGQLRLFQFGNPLGQDTDLPLPSRMALAYHKRCCLIWKVAGGANEYVNMESDDEDDDMVDYVRRERPFDRTTAQEVESWRLEVASPVAALESEMSKDTIERT
ncbi:hypothetical protein HDU96_006840 [Phlyctochytrium bullatum]|nr:hypothetical protein HDU96_006840 [Phlyctochytrium bullatum]